MATGRTFTGTSRADRLTGTANDDVFYAQGGNDIIRGGAGNDTALGGGGNDTIDGGAGTRDMAVFASIPSSYQITKTATRIVVRCTGASAATIDGTDTLTNVEILGFSAGTQTVNVSSMPNGTYSASTLFTNTGTDDLLTGLTGTYTRRSAAALTAVLDTMPLGLAGKARALTATKGQDTAASLVSGA